MKRTNRSEKDIKAQLADLEHLSHAELKARWSTLYGVPCPKHMSRKFLLGAVAYRIQENAIGGLKKSTRRHVEKVAADLASGKPIKQPGPKIKPGTRLVREWNGTVHEVIVLETAVQYRGESWPSLSAVAREITGARWSGPRFFGLGEANRG
ncbi:MAG: DUF2924 domain-containing protein [Deltaproteobacteria bacterium]|jgi:hypothetical protein|nr:DUF2924 domain-containing protein [Deltaproteobacteria bacterium]